MTGSSLVWDVFDVLRANGCSPQCSNKVHHLSALDILSYHHYFIQLPKSAKLQWIVDYLNTHSSSFNPCETMHIIAGKNVCQALWIATLGISTSLYYKARKMVSGGSIHVYRDIQRTPLQKSSRAVAWMHNYFSLIGDQMPHRMIVHLPSNLSKLSVYNRMACDMRSRGLEHIVCQSQFFRLWDEHFAHVSIPKVCQIRQLYKVLRFNAFYSRKIDSLSVIFVA